MCKWLFVGGFIEKQKMVRLAGLEPPYNSRQKTYKTIDK